MDHVCILQVTDVIGGLFVNMFKGLETQLVLVAVCGACIVWNKFIQADPSLPQVYNICPLNCTDV